MNIKQLEKNIIYGLNQSKPYPFIGDAKHIWINIVDELRKSNVLSLKEWRKLMV
jgi:hypothetical protein